MNEQSLPTRFTPELLKEIAGTLHHFGSRYEDLAERLAERGAGSTIEAKNASTLRVSLGHIQKAVNKAYEAFEDVLLETSFDGRTAAERRRDEEAEEAAIKGTARSKQRRQSAKRAAKRPRKKGT